MITGVLLAAGRGERFGGDKLRATLPDGRTLATASAEALVAALPRVIAVTRPGDDAVAEMLAAAGCEIEVCARADEGMGASLACGVGASRAASGWIIALADMPAIRPATIRGVAAHLAAGARIVTPASDGRGGHPVGFAAEFGPALAALGGDQGARPIVRAHEAEVTRFATDDPGIFHDIDTPADLATPKAD